MPLDASLGTSRLTAVSAGGRWLAGVADGSLVRVDSASGAFESFPLPPSFSQSDVSGISADGRVIVGGDGLGAFAFRDGAFEPITTGGSVLQIVPPIVSDSGLTIGASALELPDLRTGGFVIEDGQLTRLAMPEGATFSRPGAFSPDGSIIYGPLNTNDGGDLWLARWTAADAQPELLTRLPGTAGVAEFIVADATPDGSVIVGETFTPTGYGFRWTPDEGLVTYDAPLAMRLRPRGITDDGSTIVGTQRLGPGAFQAVIADEAGFEPLLDALVRTDPSLAEDLAGWTLIEAAGIAGDGNIIAGYGIDPMGVERGWMVVVPAPGSVLPLLALVGFRRRRSAV